jgi:hypothetical protein
MYKILVICTDIFLSLKMVIHFQEIIEFMTQNVFFFNNPKFHTKKS